jgi:methionine synthase II (cobalamin-independent)
LSIFDDEVQALIDAGVDMVKLDPTVDRNLFRRQRDALKALGYTFNPAAQSWTK